MFTMLIHKEKVKFIQVQKQKYSTSDLQNCIPSLYKLAEHETLPQSTASVFTLSCKSNCHQKSHIILHCPVCLLVCRLLAGLCLLRILCLRILQMDGQWQFGFYKGDVLAAIVLIDLIDGDFWWVETQPFKKKKSLQVGLGKHQPFLKISTSETASPQMSFSLRGWYVWQYRFHAQLCH